MQQTLESSQAALREGIVRMPPNASFAIETLTEVLDAASRTLKGIPFVLLLNYRQKALYYSFVADDQAYPLIESQLYASYPAIDIRPNPNPRPTEPRPGAVATMKLKFGDHYPFRTFKEQEGSIISDLFHELSQLGGSDCLFIRVQVTPLDRDTLVYGLRRSLGLSVRGLRDRLDLRQRLFSRKGSDAIRAKAMELGTSKNKEPLFDSQLAIYLSSDSGPAANAKLARIVSLFRKLESDYNEFVPAIEVRSFAESELVAINPGKAGYALTANELATVWHFPLQTDAVPNLSKILAAKGEPPIGLPTRDNTPPEELTLFGVTDYRQIREEFGIKQRDRARHMYVIGKSGSGKSRLLEQFIKSDIEQGRGLCLIDPHGDVVDSVLSLVPESRITDVIYFNPIDQEYPISFNPIEKVEPAYRPQVATDLIEVFKKIFGDQWTPRLEHVMRMSLLALLDAPQASVLSLLLLLTDRSYRQEIIKSINDQVVKNFWTNEFAGWSEKFDAEAITPILNKIGQFVSNPIIRNIVSQEVNTVMMSEIMDSRKILLVKLPKGVLGEENTTLLGAMMVTRIYQGAMTRINVPEAERIPFYLYVDEFQNFATDAFANILSESRKFKLSVTLANQYVAQLSDVIRKAVIGNVGSLISFRIGPEDAQLLEREFAPRFHASDMMNLAVREIYAKLSIDDQVRDPFSARTLDSSYPEQNFKEAIVAYTREHYCTTRSETEAKIGQEKSKEMELITKLKQENFSAPIV